MHSLTLVRREGGSRELIWKPLFCLEELFEEFSLFCPTSPNIEGSAEAGCVQLFRGFDRQRLDTKRAAGKLSQWRLIVSLGEIGAKW